jgi:DNA-binding response OmpR family regulator
MTQTILVVDDQSSVRQLVQDYLTEQGFRVVTATDGQNAIYAARHEQPDLILLDIMMPRMDGYQFLRQFRQERQTPVIIITAREEETDAVLGLDLGADDYVIKPFRMRELTGFMPSFAGWRIPRNEMKY